MALDMARAYNADPNATNLILKRLNLDIIVDQAIEIAFLQQIVDRFPGDPEAVELDRSIPGMDMMGHGGAPMEGGHGGGVMEGMDHEMPH